MIPNFEGADDLNTILARFLPAAKRIMLEHKLALGDRQWFITALELYLWTGGKWCDPCTDRKPGQAGHGTWYVNRGKNPNHGRIDIAAGNKRGMYAGLLIRELDQRDGSSIVLQKIIRGQFNRRNDHDCWTTAELERIASIDGTSVTEGTLRLVRVEPKRADIWFGPRVFHTTNPEKISYLRHPLRAATWQTEKLKTQMKRWDAAITGSG
jgi:hypothetical protein